GGDLLAERSEVRVGVLDRGVPPGQPLPPVVPGHRAVLVHGQLPFRHRKAYWSSVLSQPNTRLASMGRPARTAAGTYAGASSGTMRRDGGALESSPQRAG